MGTFIKPKKGFTLIELLVVISIIAMLLSIIMPVLRKVKESAKKLVCQSNFRQIGIAMGTYESENNFFFREKDRTGNPDIDNRSWLYVNGSADYAHEFNRMKTSLMNAGMLPDHKIFFCPSVRNLSADRNYDRSLMDGGTPAPENTQSIIDDGRQPAFWSSYVWIYKKQEVPGYVLSVNRSSNDAMMLDMTDFCYEVIKSNSLIGKSAEALGIEQTIYHYNVLMHDLSVSNPTDKDEEMNPWLWDSDLWAGKVW